jgi:hypothetical protein
MRLCSHVLLQSRSLEWLAGVAIVAESQNLGNLRPKYADITPTRMFSVLNHAESRNPFKICQFHFFNADCLNFRA